MTYFISLSYKYFDFVAVVTDLPSSLWVYYGFTIMTRISKGFLNFVVKNEIGSSVTVITKIKVR